MFVSDGLVFCIEGSTVTFFVRMHHKCMYSILIFTTVQYNEYTTMHSIEIHKFSFLQMKGLPECFNWTMSRCLAKMINNNQQNWDRKIDTILVEYQTSTIIHLYNTSLIPCCSDYRYGYHYQSTVSCAHPVLAKWLKMGRKLPRLSDSSLNHDKRQMLRRSKRRRVTESSAQWSEIIMVVWVLHPVTYIVV